MDPQGMIFINENEDLLSPNYKTLSVILQARRKGCNGYIILIANADETMRFLRFGDRHRVIDTRARFFLLHDVRLFHKDYFYLWKKIVNVIFIRKFFEVNRYELMTVPFPSPIVHNWKPIRIDSWKSGKYQKNNELFIDKTSDLRGEIVHVAVFEYMPSVLKKVVEDDQSGNIMPIEYSGLEVLILRSLSDAMNFQILIYEPPNSKTEAWGKQQLNGSYTGLLGEMVSGRADFALGNFLYTPKNIKLFDLSIPYITQCFTFLTPESTTDNTWKTLILPFKKFMWLGVMLTLVVSSLVFYVLANFHKYSKLLPINVKRDIPLGLYLFDGIGNSLINAYSMLLLVSLPKVPSGWSLRMLTGWWWLYCILVTVAYRASMTAILANPAQRVTINTLEELASSPILCGGWGEQNKEFFTTSLDSAGQRVGHKFEVVYDSNASISRVAQGNFAYYENIYFLHYAKVTQKVMTEFENGSIENSSNNLERKKDLHIMSDCVINMPISLGLQKNSPLKPRVDKFLQRVIEAGLVKKWLADVMLTTVVAEAPFEKNNINAVMDLKKFVGALVALGIGYGLGTMALIIENIYWYYVVQKNPLFDKYKQNCNMK
nr:glutamate receptor ionotropic, delta-2 [Halyomorpha halys]